MQNQNTFTAEAASQYAKWSDEAEDLIDSVINKHFEELGADLRLNVVKPFCQKFNLSFTTQNGAWFFHYSHAGVDNGKMWDVGDQPRRLAGRPDGLPGDEDCWFAAVTEEDRNIRKVLNTPDYRGCPLGSWVTSYPDKRGI